MNCKLLCFNLGVLAMVGLAGCSDDDPQWADVDGGVPGVALESAHIRTEQGRSITVKGEITDKDGIASIHLSCPGIYLDKVIDIIGIYGEPRTSYSLDYTHKINSEIPSEEFTLRVEVTDVGGRTSSQDVKVTMDGDFVPPMFTARPSENVTVLIKENTTLTVKFAVEDDKALESVTVAIPAFNISETTTDFADGKTFSFNKSFPVPSQEGQYDLTVTARDRQDHEVTFKAVYNVQELPDFDKMYLADVETAAELNSDVFGVPMLVDHVGPYKYRARYYNAVAGTKICFIPQNTDFSPICFAPDNDNPAVLGDDPDATTRITLDRGGVYYLIDFNTLTREYSMSTYSVEEAVDPVMHLSYGGNDLNTWWETTKLDEIWWQEWYFGPADGPGNVTRMERDKKNPHLYYIEQWKLEEGGMNFILHNWHSHGWWNFTTWRVDDSLECNKVMYYGNFHPETPHYKSNKDYFDYKFADDPTFDLNKWGDESYRKNYVPDNWMKPEVKTAGTYRFEFDAHLERARLVKVY